MSCTAMSKFRSYGCFADEDKQKLSEKSSQLPTSSSMEISRPGWIQDGAS